MSTPDPRDQLPDMSQEICITILFLVFTNRAGTTEIGVLGTSFGGNGRPLGAARALDLIGLRPGLFAVHGQGNMERCALTGFRGCPEFAAMCLHDGSANG